MNDWNFKIFKCDENCGVSNHRDGNLGNINVWIMDYSIEPSLIERKDQE